MPHTLNRFFIKCQATETISIKIATFNICIPLMENAHPLIIKQNSNASWQIQAATVSAMCWRMEFGEACGALDCIAKSALRIGYTMTFAEQIGNIIWQKSVLIGMCWRVCGARHSFAVAAIEKSQSIFIFALCNCKMHRMKRNQRGVRGEGDRDRDRGRWMLFSSEHLYSASFEF